jgi:hypothetical protein
VPVFLHLVDPSKRQVVCRQVGVSCSSADSCVNAFFGEKKPIMAIIGRIKINLDFFMIYKVYG